MTMQKRKKMTLYMKVFFAALISLIQIMPIVVVVVNSFRGNDEISKLMLGIAGMLIFIPTVSVIYTLFREWVYARLEKKQLVL